MRQSKFKQTYLHGYILAQCVEIKVQKSRKPDVNRTQTLSKDRQENQKGKEHVSTQVRGRSYEATNVGTPLVSNGERGFHAQERRNTVVILSK